MPNTYVTMADMIRRETLKCAERVIAELKSKGENADELRMQFDQLAVEVTEAFEKAGIE